MANPNKNRPPHFNAHAFNRWSFMSSQTSAKELTFGTRARAAKSENRKRSGGAESGEEAGESEWAPENNATEQADGSRGRQKFAAQIAKNRDKKSKDALHSTY